MHRKSRRFDGSVLPITTAVAGALLATGCSGADRANTDVAICRDARGMRVDDVNCGTGGRGGAGGAAWHYYGRGDRVPALGEAADGGSAAPRAGTSYSRASSATVSRGGFGSSAHGSSGE